MDIKTWASSRLGQVGLLTSEVLTLIAEKALLHDIGYLIFLNRTEHILYLHSGLTNGMTSFSIKY